MTRPAPRPDPGEGRDPRSQPYPHRRPASLGPLRLPLFARVSRTWHGTWLPYSRALTREGADLVDDFPATRGRIDRLACSPEEWEGDVSGAAESVTLVMDDHKSVSIRYLRFESSTFSENATRVPAWRADHRSVDSGSMSGGSR